MSRSACGHSAATFSGVSPEPTHTGTRTAARTVFPLGTKKKVDLFGLRRRYAFLEPLLDADYGSASFVPVSEPAELELRVSTTGLLIRDTRAAQKQP